MHEHTSSPPCAHDLAVLDADWHRCERDARHLMLLELALVIAGVGVLVVVAVCGIVAITHTAVETGAVAIPLGLGLSVTLALVLLGLSARARVGHELLMENIMILKYARRAAAAQRANGDVRQPYRVAPSRWTPCPYCIFEDTHRSA
jgi:hypothetical protein